MKRRYRGETERVKVKRRIIILLVDQKSETTIGNHASERKIVKQGYCKRDNIMNSKSKRAAKI